MRAQFFHDDDSTLRFAIPAARMLRGLSRDNLAECACLCCHSIRKGETSSDAVPAAAYSHLCRAVDDGEGARFSAMPTRGMSRGPNL